jgi:hypothetical protein
LHGTNIHDRGLRDFSVGIVLPVLFFLSLEITRRRLSMKRFISIVAARGMQRLTATTPAAT